MTQIRRAGPDDLEQIHALFHHERQRLPTSPATAEWLAEYPGRVALEAGVLVGFAYTKRFGPDVLELSNLYVDPAWRDRGIGARLLSELERLAQPAWRAIVLVNSLGYPGKEGGRLAGNFYERAGYTRAADTGMSLVYAKTLARTDEPAAG